MSCNRNSGKHYLKIKVDRRLEFYQQEDVTINQKCHYCGENMEVVILELN